MSYASKRAPVDAVPERGQPGVGPRSPALGDKKTRKPPHRETSPDYSTWAAMVTRIRANDERGMADLYALFSKGIRFYLCRQLGPQELDDKVHDTFLIVVQAIRRGDLREPERLMGFVRTVVRRQVAAYIVHRRREQADLDAGLPIADGRLSPEELAISSQRVKIMKEVLDGISGRDREILTRFYLHEQTQKQICTEMNLSETQFRLLKSRAKARFGELGRKKLARRPLARLFLRDFPDSRH